MLWNWYLISETKSDKCLISFLIFSLQRSHPGSADEADNITDEEIEGEYSGKLI